MNNYQLFNAMQRSGNPQTFIYNVIKENGNPEMQNMVKLIESNQTDKIEDTARQIFKNKGLDFDKEFKSFKNQMGIR